jgi:hypothetical protein
MQIRSFVTGCWVGVTALVIASASLCVGQEASSHSSYIEMSWMKVKQDKVGEFGQMATRIADANRRGKGDNWVAYMDMYGKDNYIWMGSRRSSLSDIEPGMMKFMGAIKEFMGFTPDRFFAEASKLVEGSGTELWRQRFDLSWNVKDADEWGAQLAKAHFVAVAKVHLKPGHILDAEKQIAMIRDAVLEHGDKNAAAVTQIIEGGDPATFYVRVPLASMADLEKMATPRSVLGEEGYQKYSEMTAQNYATVEYSLKRMVPEWSNPPASFVEANPEMWKVKPMAAPKPKPAANTKATTGGTR